MLARRLRQNLQSATVNESLQTSERRIRAADGFELAASVYAAGTADTVLIVNSATAVPRRFYRHFASWLQARGVTVITFDYRGIGDSRPDDLRGFAAGMRDWALLDMTAVLDWAAGEFRADKLVAVGHSFGGQAAGMLENAGRIDGLVGVSSQSGYWAIQGGLEPIRVGFAVMLLMPGLARLLGYFPWRLLAGGEDLPRGVALEWSRWARHPRYLLGDDSLPLDRYARFEAPVLAYSIDDDNWGTARAVDAMMQAYPNVERRHVVPGERGLPALGHMGFFRPGAEPLWEEVSGWVARL